MKTGKLIPLVIALIVLLSGPFSHVRICDSDPRGGLICYCCSASGQKCTMISCSGCCGSRSRDAIDRWSPEMVLALIHPFSPLPLACWVTQIFQTPESVFLDIPHQPPKTV
jgi:hypothetical protein